LVLSPDAFLGRRTPDETVLGVGEPLYFDAFLEVIAGLCPLYPSELLRYELIVIPVVPDVFSTLCFFFLVDVTVPAWLKAFFPL
jgi:hypothetical protein